MRYSEDGTVRQKIQSARQRRRETPKEAKAAVATPVVVPPTPTGVVSHQKLRKMATYAEDLQRYGEAFFERPIGDYTFGPEQTKDIKAFIERYEYLGTVGISPRWVYGARLDGVLACVVCFNLPNAFSKTLGPNTRQYECLIQRGASASFAHKHLSSKTIALAIDWMVKNTDKRLFCAYADCTAAEIGTIYQSLSMDFLGFKFGTKELYLNPDFKNGRPFSAQSLRRTVLFKKWWKAEYNEPFPSAWLNPKNGFKDMSKVPPEHKRWLYDYGNRIIAASRKVSSPPKGKYILVKGKDRKEQRLLESLKNYRTYPYPKRDDPKIAAMLKKAMDFAVASGTGFASDAYFVP